MELEIHHLNETRSYECSEFDVYQDSTGEWNVEVDGEVVMEGLHHAPFKVKASE